jgi:hypothetical protein
MMRLIKRAGTTPRGMVPHTGGHTNTATTLDQVLFTNVLLEKQANPTGLVEKG